MQHQPSHSAPQKFSNIAKLYCTVLGKKQHKNSRRVRSNIKIVDLNIKIVDLLAGRGKQVI